MTEKEKAALGVPYDPNNDPELIAERTAAKSLCSQYNLISPAEIGRREELIRRLLGKIGRKFLIEQPFYCDYGYNAEIGENFYSNINCVILDAAKVIFGDNVFIGPNCGFYAAGHPLDHVERNRGIEYARPITIGDSVWFGGNVIVMPGVEIGERCVIGAGSVVTKNIPPGVLVCGNPCKVIKTIE